MALASGGVPIVLNFEASLSLLTGLPVDSGGVIYSNLLESRVNVIGPYVSPAANSEWRKRNAIHEPVSPH